MFKSSMNTISLFPGGGPNVSLVLFSTLASRLRCTSIEVVREEKLMFRSSYEKDSILKVRDGELLTAVSESRLRRKF